MGNRQQEQYRLECHEIGGESASGQAIRVYPKCDTNGYWIPLSQVHSIHRDPDAPYLYITPWIAREKGLL